MKRRTKTVLLSAFATTMAATAITAIAWNVLPINKAAASNTFGTTEETVGFEMLDGASIRMANPLGLRFIAEMGKDVYDDLMTKETGVEKKMGMFIVPYIYLSDASQYTDGTTGVEKGNYQNLKQKIDRVFYDSTEVSSEDKDGEIYEYEAGEIWRANGVISNLSLADYDKEFVGIAYIAETIGSTTMYTFADFGEKDDVRNSTYVAIEAYEDYTDEQARSVFKEYVLGAHLSSLGMTETVTGTGDGRSVTYTYGGNRYDTITEAATAAGVSLSVSLEESVVSVKKVGESTQLTATIADNGTPVAFGGAHAIWSSSDESVATVDENGKVTAVSAGSATITANFMDTSATCDVIVPLSETEVLTYNATVEEESDGVRSGILLEASTHTGGTNALPLSTADTEDMSYIKFGGSYGLNDYLVFDFTGDNVPYITFFNSVVSNTVYNQAEDENVKGWIVANGVTMNNGVLYGGVEGAHANRLAMIGPYKISYRYDDNGSNTVLTQGRRTEGSAASPSPISMHALQSVTNPYRMIIGWTEGSSSDSMDLNIVVIDLTTGQKVVGYNGTDYSSMRGFSRATWEGDIALYGHFGKDSYLDALYPIEEDTTVDEVLAKYMPSIVVYNGEWKGDGLTLNQSIYDDGNTNSSAANSPTSADMSYIAFNGTYGLNDYVVFDFTGDNMPIVSFFNNEVTNTIYNNASAGGTIADSTVRGWVWFNGLYRNNGVVFGGASETNVHWQRLTLVGSHKVVGFDNNNNDFRVCLGSASVPNPLSIYKLQSVTDTYRMIIGIGENASSTSKVNVEMCAINMITGKQVYKYVWEVSNTDFEEGSIALHGQFGKTTVLDKVFGVEEDATLETLIEKYAKDTDYSDEGAVALDRYAYSSLSNGQWTLDGTAQVTNPTDYRTMIDQYTVYKDAGFNIVLAQDMISPDVSAEEWAANGLKFMDLAYEAGLKVILTDWHIQVLSKPIAVNSGGIAAADSTYVPWIIGTDASATVGLAKEYMDIVSGMGLTIDSTRFSNRASLDAFIASQLAPYKDHPAFYGVMLGDEPSYQNAYCYGEIYKSLKRVMPDIYVQYNLLPMEHSFGTIRYRYPGVNGIGSSISNAQIEAAYKQYVELFLDSMGTDYIQYDDYPFKSAEEGILIWKKEVPYIDPTSLRNLQLIAEIAKERGLAVKVVTQTSFMKTGGADGTVHIRQITEDDARWLNNYLLGFGVKQINYFTYWTKAACSSTGEYFVDGGSFMNRDGTKTELYTFMQTIMANNTAFASTISHFDYNGSVVVTGSSYKFDDEHIVWGTMTADSFRFVTDVKTSTDATLVTELYDDDNYNYMYTVMNTIDPYEKNGNGEDTTQTITVTFDSSVTQIYVYDQTGARTKVTLTDNTYTVELTAGQAVYLLPCL